MISAGYLHSLFLNDEGFGCGDNDKQQLNIHPDLILISEDWILK
jgi:hypothetical protein